MSEAMVVVPCAHEWNGKRLEIRTGYRQMLKHVLATCSICGIPITLEPKMFELTDLPTEHGAKLDELIRQYDIHSVLEIGTFMGSSAAFFAKYPQIDMVTVIDPFVVLEGDPWLSDIRRLGIPNPFYEVFERNIKATGLWHKFRVLRGKSAEMVDLAPMADLVYVDGPHDYDNCANDIRLYLPKAHKLLVGDDHHYNEHGVPHFPGVVRAVAELLPEAQNNRQIWWYDVQRARRDYDAKR